MRHHRLDPRQRPSACDYPGAMQHEHDRERPAKATAFPQKPHREWQHQRTRHQDQHGEVRDPRHVAAPQGEHRGDERKGQRVAVCDVKPEAVRHNHQRDQPPAAQEP